MIKFILFVLVLVSLIAVLGITTGNFGFLFSMVGVGADFLFKPFSMFITVFSRVFNRLFTNAYISSLLGILFCMIIITWTLKVISGSVTHFSNVSSSFGLGEKIRTKKYLKYSAKVNEQLSSNLRPKLKYSVKQGQIKNLRNVRKIALSDKKIRADRAAVKSASVMKKSIKSFNKGERK